MPSYSNYPGGFANGVTIRGMPINVLHPGKVFWVGNAAAAALAGQKSPSDGNQGTFNDPFSTLDYAIGRCSAGRGDVIMVKPGHAENILVASGITMDVSGVAVVGLGSGALRPKFSFTVAAATFVVSAPNCSFYNIQWEANVADVAVGLDVSGVDGLSWDSCYFTESGANLNFVVTMDLATGADDLYIDKCKFITNDIANTSHIKGVDHSGLYIKDSYFAANTAQTVVTGLIATSGNATNVLIKDCDFRSNVDGALWVDFNGAANSGVISNCYVSSLDIAGATSTGDFTGGHFFECYVSGEADAFGLVGGGGVVYNNA